MSHPFGDRLNQHLHRKHGLNQSRLAAGILQAPAIITDMCKGRRLRGSQARERVIQIIAWLQQQGALNQRDEANALLNAAGMAALQPTVADEATLLARLSSAFEQPAAQFTSTPRNTPRSHLPLALTPLIGRSQEVAAIRRSILQEEGRLLTLVGPPGVGKTRLAVQVAGELTDHFVDGVWYVPLATLHEVALAPNRICQALGLQESSLPPLDHLQLFLGEKDTLLVLDNLEQILGVAPLLVALLTSCPRLHLLLTSRAPLRVRAERQFPVLPLTLPDLARLPDSTTLGEVAAVELFVERGQRVQPALALTPENALTVATICTRLDGLPLAIELVAARLKLFSPAALLARLDGPFLLNSDGLRDSAPHQQTLRDAICWSYDLLTPAEQNLLAHLGIFMGGFTLEAAEVILEAQITNVMDGLASLVDKSLLQALPTQDEPRFSMLETIHEYALEQLTDSGALAEVQRRHAEFYVQLAETADPYLRTGEQITWLKRLDAERANLRAALAWSASAAGDPVVGLRLANALGTYWYLRALYGEGTRWLDTLLARAGAASPATLRAWALYNNCLQAVGLDDNTRGIALGEAAQTLARMVDDQRLLGYLGLPLSQHIFCRQGRAHSQVRLTEGLQQARLLADPWLIDEFTARLIPSESDPTRRRALRIETLAQARTIGDRTLICCILGHWAVAAIESGDYAAAQSYYQESLLLARELEDKRNMMVVLNCGDLACIQGFEERAAAYYQEGLNLAQQTGTPGLIGLAHVRLGRLAQRQGKLAEALCHYQAGLHIVQPFDHRLFVAPCLLLMATLVDLPDTPLAVGQAMRLAGAATAILPLEHMLIEPTDLPDMQRTLARLRARLDDPIFAAAWAEGQAMTVDEAIAYALALSPIDTV